ncbi:AbrB/MazE/SpoVT family DNA-binding domain-containing protein [Pseudothioglobus sp. nBUS_23]|uniref:AbrB/MazE/SpoVT family DNA-binding domain-containing protein n=1 Tax=Pseudothioglobus sp. nBUS_23 TaxID=3395318 RepID=UPI003EBA8837
MAKIIQIGNSQGIRIPKPLIALANLEGKELEYVVMDSGLLITPEKKVRVGWENDTDNLSVEWEWSKTP